MNVFSVYEKIYIAVQNFLSYITGGSKCIGCGKKCLALPLCKECRNLINSFVRFSSDDNSRCKKCGRILLSELEECFECRQQTTEGNICRFFPIHSYRLWKKDLMYFWKSKNFRSMSLLFCDLVFAALKNLEHEQNLVFDCIVPVPPRPGKLKKKGWDQIDELSLLLEKKYKVKVKHPLIRLDSKEQKKLNKEEREKSSGAEYSLKKNWKYIDKKVLILDDVITTGSTMEKCAFLLKKIGAKEVYGMSLFIVD